MLTNFFQTSNWENESTNLESKIKSIAHEHLDVLPQNFEFCFANNIYWIGFPCYGLCSPLQMIN